jgi:hypothetical protein
VKNGSNAFTFTSSGIPYQPRSYRLEPTTALSATSHSHAAISTKSQRSRAEVLRRRQSKITANADDADSGADTLGDQHRVVGPAHHRRQQVVAHGRQERQRKHDCGGKANTAAMPAGMLPARLVRPSRVARTA